MAEPIYQFTAPNGVVYRIGGAPDEDAARLRARQYFRDEFPEQFAEWERSQPPAGFLAGVGRSFRSALGEQVAGAGLQLEERGLPGGETLRGAGEAITGQATPGERLLEAGTVLDDLRQRPVATALTGLGQAVGSVAGSIAAPLAIAGGAAALGASAPVVAGAGLAAGIASGAFGGTGELYQMLVAEGVAPERARTLAANVGAAIGAAEGGAAVPIARQILGTAVRRETAERLAEVAARSATGAGLREAGRGAVIEGGSEAAGGAARQAVVAAETGNVDLARRAGEVAFEGVLGAVGGAGVAGVAGTRAPARARAEIEARLTPEERAARQAAAEQPPEATATQPEPPPGPVLPDAPLPVESAEQANEIIAARGLRLPEGIDDTGRIAAANIALNNEYRTEVDRIRNNELDTFLGRSQLQPAAEGAPQDLAPAADALTRNVLTAIGEGRLSEPRFTSRQITDLALENLGDAGPVPVRTRTQVKKYLDALQEAGYLQPAGKIGKDTAYTLPLRQAEAQAAPVTAPAATAAAAAPPVVSEAPVAQPTVNVEPEVPAAPPVAQAITLTDLATNPQSASQFLDRAFAQNPGAINSVQSLQAAARNEGLVLPPDLATGLFAQARQSGILSPTNLYVPPAKRAQRQQAPAAAAATQALNQIAQTGTPATISPQAAQQTAAAQQASEDLQQAVQAAPAPTSPRTAATPTTPASSNVSGFTTARGSTYQINEAGQTIRTKRSPGRGQGETYAPHNVLFVSPDTAQNLLEEMRGGGRYRFVVDDNGTTRELGQTEAIGNRRAGIAILRPDGTSEIIPAQTTPAVGLAPVELRYDQRPDGMYASRHIGNTITEVQTSPPPNLADVPTGGAPMVESDTGFVDSAGDPIQVGDTVRSTSKTSGNTNDWTVVSVYSGSSGPRLILESRGKRTNMSQEEIQSTPNRLLNVREGRTKDTAPAPSVSAPRRRTDFAAPQGGTRAARTEAEQAEARQAFERVVGPRGRLTFEQTLFLQDLGAEVQAAAQAAGITGPIAGYASGDLAVLSLADSTMPLNQVAIHEGWHVAENIGIIKANDIAILNASRDTILNRIRNDLDFVADPDSLSNDEVRAYGANARVSRGTDFGGTVNAIYDRLANFVDRLRNFVAGRGFNSWRDVYDNFLSGRTASLSLPGESTTYGSTVNFAVSDRAILDRIPELEQAAQGLKDGTVTRERYEELVNALKPVRPYTEVPSPATQEEMANALTSDKVARIGIPSSILQEGEPVGLRLDIPAYSNHGVWVVSVHEQKSGFGAGLSIGYESVAAVTNPTLGVVEKAALNIAAGKPKSTIATVKGNWRPVSPAEAERIAIEAINDPSWVQVGMDPTRHAYFYNRATMEPVVAGTEAIQIGPLVLVKNPVYAPKTTFNFAAPRPVSTPQQMQQATQQYFENQIRGPAKWFSSLDLSIAKDRPALRPAADNMQTFRMSRNEANADLEPRLEKLARLSPESSRKVMRVWQTASMTETAPNVSILNAEERAALTDAIAGIQRAFDWLIEGYVSDYYIPNAKMPAAEQARLNAFWQRNSGKHLWEIPARELQAASPKGYQEYQRLNKMRNPYKLPAIADGSHFVAVYKRNAAGQREGKPIAMIAYTPRSQWQKLMRVPDPEVIARNELQRLYPNTTTHIVRQRGQQFTQGAEAGGIRSVGDAVTQFLSGLTSLPQFANSTGARNKLQSLLDTLNKQQMDRVFRRSDDVLLAVNDLTDTSYGLDALPRYLLGISNIQARRRTQNDWAEAIKPLTPDDKKYLNDLRDYASTPTESFAGIRSLTFFSLLGFAPDSMAINMLQTVQATMPMMLRDGGVGALRHFGRAYRELTQATGQATKSLLSSNRQNPVDIMTNILRDPQELADYKKALDVGTLLPLYLNESRGQVSVAAMRRLGFRNPEQRTKNFNSVLRLSGGMQAFAEQTNRAVSFLAAYRAAKADPQIIANKNRTDNLQLQTPYDYATSIVNDTHFVTDKSDRALYQRFTPAAEVVTQFMSFVTKTIELYVRQAKLLYRGIAQGDMHLARAGAVGFIGTVAPIVALAGIWALPGAEFLKEALEALVGAVWGTTQNFDADMRRAVGGGFIGEAFSAGLPSTVGLASLSKRLALDPVPFNDIKSMEIFSLMGPSGSFIEKIGQFYNYMAQGDIANALVAFPLMPRAAGNIIKGVDIGLGSETIRSQRGNVLISPEQIAEIDSQNLVPVSVRQAIGLPSPAIMNLREALVRREELAKQNSVATTRFNDTAAGYYTDALRAQREGDNDRAARAFQRLQQHIRSQVEANAEAANAGRLDAIININMTAIRRRAYEDLMGRTSPQLGLRGVPQNIRPRAQEELQLYNWRGIGAPSN